jgi:hypothetical protein
MKNVTLIIVLINILVVPMFSQDNETIKAKQESNISEKLNLEETGEYVLALINRKNSKKVVLKKDHTIKVIYEGYVYGYNRIDSITPEFVIVDGFPFELSRIQKIKYKYKKTSIPGAIFTLVGGALTITGIAGLAAGFSDDDEGINSVQKGVGTIVMVAGLAVSVTGLTQLAYGSKKYDLVNDWEAKTEILIE